MAVESSFCLVGHNFSLVVVVVAAAAAAVDDDAVQNSQ